MSQARGGTRILLVVDGLAGGGAERILLDIGAGLAQRGHAVAIASLRDERVYVIPEGVSLIPCYDTSPRKLRKIGEIGRRSRILDHALAETPPADLVVSSLHVSDRIVRASHLADVAWYRIPNPLSVEMLEPVAGLKRARRRARLRRTYDGRKLVAISHGVARDLVENLGVRPSRLEVVYNPFDVERIRELSRAPCEMAGEDFLVCVARFNRQKRHDRLLEAFGRARYTGRLVLVGSGSDDQVSAVEARISSLGLEGRVDLVGFHHNPYPFIRHARSLVLGSDFEGFGNVLVEALVCGTPVVSTRCPHGPEEILTDELSIGLADLTPVGLAAAIDRVIDHPPLIRPQHYERFSLDTITSRYLALAD